MIQMDDTRFISWFSPKKVNSMGAVKAIARLLSSMNEVRNETLPPSIPVITAAAEAVGVRKSSIIACERMGLVLYRSAPTVHPMAWIDRSMACSLLNFSSLGDSLVKVSSSIPKISHGVITEMEVNSPLNTPPMIIASGSVQSLRKRIINYIICLVWVQR